MSFKFSELNIFGKNAYATGPLTAAVTLYVMIYGYAILVGRVSDPLNEFIWRCLKLGVILMLVKNAGDYNTYVADVFFNTLPREIAGALNAGQATTAATFDGLLAKGQEVVTQLWTQAGFGISASICSALAAVIVIVCVSFLAAVGFCVSLYAKIALSLCLALGPLFIALAMFDATRRFTESWIGTLVNFTILQVLVAAIGSLLITSFQSLVNSHMGGGVDILAMPIGIAAISIVSIYLFYELPGIAAALAGGGASLAYGFSARRDVEQGEAGMVANANT